MKNLPYPVRVAIAIAAMIAAQVILFYPIITNLINN